MTLLCKKITVMKSKVKTRYNLAEPFKEGYGSKMAVLLLLLMIMNKTLMVKTVFPKRIIIIGVVITVSFQDSTTIK
jgi:hypothetical protein